MAGGLLSTIVERPHSTSLGRTSVVRLFADFTGSACESAHSRNAANAIEAASAPSPRSLFLHTPIDALTLQRTSTTASTGRETRDFAHLSNIPVLRTSSLLVPQPFLVSLSAFWLIEASIRESQAFGYRFRPRSAADQPGGKEEASVHTKPRPGASCGAPQIDPYGAGVWFHVSHPHFCGPHLARWSMLAWACLLTRTVREACLRSILGPFLSGPKAVRFDPPPPSLRLQGRHNLDSLRLRVDRFSVPSPPALIGQRKAPAVFHYIASGTVSQNFLVPPVRSRKPGLRRLLEHDPDPALGLAFLAKAVTGPGHRGCCARGGRDVLPGAGIAYFHSSNIAPHKNHVRSKSARGDRGPHCLRVRPYADPAPRWLDWPYRVRPPLAQVVSLPSRFQCADPSASWNRIG